MDEEAASKMNEFLYSFKKGIACFRLGPLAAITIGLSVLLGIMIFLTELKNRIELKNHMRLKKLRVDITDSAFESKSLNDFHRQADKSGHAFSEGFHERNKVEKSFSSPIIEKIRSFIKIMSFLFVNIKE